MPLNCVNFALSTRVMDVTMSRATSGRWQEATMPLAKVKQTAAKGSVFQKQKMAHPKHASAK